VFLTYLYDLLYITIPLWLLNVPTSKKQQTKPGVYSSISH